VVAPHQPTFVWERYSTPETPKRREAAHPHGNLYVARQEIWKSHLGAHARRRATKEKEKAQKRRRSF
jgi:hypothetical protein